MAWWMSGADDRAKQVSYAKREAKERAYQEERERHAYIEPREVWREEDLQAYDGGRNETGPILLAVKGDVFNVWKGRNFYGKGGEYHIMAGRDATRFLAKNRLEEESDEEKSVDLNIAERANLEAWYWTIKNKYQLVGSLDGYDDLKPKEN
jgi:membrane-associated progesterone receptor component